MDSARTGLVSELGQLGQPHSRTVGARIDRDRRKHATLPLLTYEYTPSVSIKTTKHPFVTGPEARNAQPINAHLSKL